MFQIIFIFFRQHTEKLEEFSKLQEKFSQEAEAKSNREMQIAELEQTLAKESERAADFKVRLCRYLPHFTKKKGKDTKSDSEN